MLDAIELIECDRRIQVVFTQAPDVFRNGVDEHLRALGAVVIPWQQATETDFDLVVAADCAGVPELHGPVLMLAHGVMNNKLAPANLGGPGSGLVVGLAAPWLTWYGRLFPATVALSHRDLLSVLTRQCPQAVPIAKVVGDLCLDRLTASTPRRTAYRHALGVADDRTVVALSSTWGPDSLLGRSWRTLFDLLAELPEDAYAVRLAVHPALWHGHGPRQVLSWLREHRGSGLRVVEPTSWRGLVAAADVVVGDHGSATTYAAAARVPVLRSAGPTGFTAPGSATELLAQLVPVFTPGRPLPAQLDDAMRMRPAGQTIGRAVTSAPGAAARLLRAEMYRLLRLPEPSAEPVAAPVPPPVLVEW
ncbi:hypothetical protein [Plantactinospora sp. CA-290183]|uniref:hypothetical protein n=1 Tax=Plantactinospora sp. CA-290183 TaxID=3240006 RepID=UPI003D89B611